MKNLFFLGLVSLYLFSCTKEKEQELVEQHTSIQTEPLAATAPNQEANLDADLLQLEKLKSVSGSFTSESIFTSYNFLLKTNETE